MAKRWASLGAARVEHARLGVTPSFFWSENLSPVILAFDALGAGSCRIVLLHGWPLRRTIWQEIAPSVASEGFRVLLPDLPGFGDSPSLETGRETVEAYADEVAAFLRALGPEPVALAGHSFGGYVALALADRHPTLVAGLGLVASRTLADSEAGRRGRQETIE